jgi:hypothetical protein
MALKHLPSISLTPSCSIKTLTAISKLKNSLSKEIAMSPQRKRSSKRILLRNSKEERLSLRNTVERSSP